MRLLKDRYSLQVKGMCLSVCTAHPFQSSRFARYCNNETNIIKNINMRPIKALTKKVNF